MDNEWLETLQNHLHLKPEFTSVVALSRKGGGTYLLLPGYIRFSDLGDVINSLLTTTIQLAEAQGLDQEFIFRLQTANDILTSKQGIQQ